MKLYKKSERHMRAESCLEGFRKFGMTTASIGRWKKWKELRDGGRVSVHIDVFELKDKNQVQGYLIGDTLGKVAAPIVLDKQEVLDWLKDKGYKTEKQWYLEDNGMDEETWDEWNNA